MCVCEREKERFNVVLRERKKSNRGNERERYNVVLREKERESISCSRVLKRDFFFFEIYFLEVLKGRRREVGGFTSLKRRIWRSRGLNK